VYDSDGGIIVDTPKKNTNNFPFLIWKRFFVIIRQKPGNLMGLGLWFTCFLLPIGVLLSIFEGMKASALHEIALSPGLDRFLIVLKWDIVYYAIRMIGIPLIAIGLTGIINGSHQLVIQHQSLSVSFLFKGALRDIKMAIISLIGILIVSFLVTINIDFFNESGVSPWISAFSVGISIVLMIIVTGSVIIAIVMKDDKTTNIRTAFRLAFHTWKKNALIAIPLFGIPVILLYLIFPGMDWITRWIILVSISFFGSGPSAIFIVMLSEKWRKDSLM
jgi:hypothetical protein